MPKYGLLIDYEFCTGCHTCEIACKQEHDLPVGKWGIKVLHIGPMETSSEKYSILFIPAPTDLCDLCKERTEKGKLPACVHHCQANVMKFGKIEELTEELRKKPKMVLWVPC